MVLEDKVVLAGDPEGEEPEEEEEEEEEIVDPQDTFKEECSQTSGCQQIQEILQNCNSRVESRTKTEETCNQELFDFVSCVDKCVAPKLFKVLK